MTQQLHHSAHRLQDEFGQRVASRLSQGAAALPHDLTERLRAARVQAVARRKIASLQTAPVFGYASAGTSAGGQEHPGLWSRIAAALPLIALVAGLVAIHTVQNERRAREVAEVDAALLTDALPPAAYTDPGFVQFLRADQ